MGRSFTNRARLAYYLAWLPMTALVAVVFDIRGLPTPAAIIWSLGLCLPYAIICGSSFYLARAMPLRRIRILQVLANLLVASVVAAGIWRVLAGLAFHLFGNASRPQLEDQYEVLFGLGAAFFALSLAFHYLILALVQIRQAEKAVDQSQLMTREAELRALRAQVDPHFLFNSLNSIAALTALDPPKAQEMCRMLADFFRQTLRQGQNEKLTLAEELTLARNYLAIEQIRFADRMAVTEQIDPAAHTLELPPLLLQPLVENAIKHGISKNEKAGWINIEVTADENRVVIEIQNNFDADRPTAGSGSGNGLRIVQERLLSFYGDPATMSTSQKNNRFSVRLQLPTKLRREP